MDKFKDAHIRRNQYVGFAQFLLDMGAVIMPKKMSRKKPDNYQTFRLDLSKKKSIYVSVVSRKRNKNILSVTATRGYDPAFYVDEFMRELIN